MSAAIPKFKTIFETTTVPALMQQLNLKNVMQVPRLKKIVINVGLSQAVQNPKLVDACQAELYAITGQKPLVTKSKKSIANFKLREDFPIGCMITLRGETMFNFLFKLINVSLPRVRDFQGVKITGFDQFANYNLGIKEQIIFPEINFDEVQALQGMNISIITSTTNREFATALLKALGMPFINKTT